MKNDNDRNTAEYLKADRDKFLKTECLIRSERFGRLVCSLVSLTDYLLQEW